MEKGSTILLLKGLFIIVYCNEVYTRPFVALTFVIHYETNFVATFLFFSLFFFLCPFLFIMLFYSYFLLFFFYRDRANIVTSIKSIKCHSRVRTKTDRVAYHSIIAVSCTSER